MPFSETAREVAVRTKHRMEGMEPLRVRWGVAVVNHPRRPGVQPRKHRGARWNANSILTIRPGEQNSFARQPVDVRRLDQRMTRTAHDVGAMLVAEEQQNIGPAALVLRRGGLVAATRHGRRTRRRNLQKCPSFDRYPFNIARKPT